MWLSKRSHKVLFLQAHPTQIKLLWFVRDMHTLQTKHKERVAISKINVWVYGYKLLEWIELHCILKKPLQMVQLTLPSV